MPASSSSGTTPKLHKPRKKWPLYVIAALAAIVLVFVAVVAMQPAEFRIERSTLVSAPPSAPFAQVNDFRNWPGWNPFSKMDPEQKTTLEGPPAGPGAIYKWTGNQSGAGTMTILETEADKLVRIKLEFTKPMPATNTAEFSFAPEGDQTRVTWSMYGSNNFVGKAFDLLMNMDKMVGGEFEKGLADIKQVVETGSGT